MQENVRTVVTNQLDNNHRGGSMANLFSSQIATPFHQMAKNILHGMDSPFLDATDIAQPPP